ncbi:MAG: rhomboid family intramembrane serine protease, partial [Phycisphaerales bacterium]|nr:rhomboid family intramembrane serine protease [Phycisphaerales bacterium]
PKVLHGYVWQLFTYMWLHAVDRVGHIAFNLLALYFFGTVVEQELGIRRFLRGYFVCGVVAGLAVVLVDVIGAAIAADGVAFMTSIATHSTPVVGASGAIMGIIGGFCWLNWDRWISLFITRVKGKHLVLVFLAIDIVRFLLGQGIAITAHVAGLGFGLAWFSGWGNPRVLYLKLKLRWVRRRLRVVNGGRDDRNYMN